MLQETNGTLVAPPNGVKITNGTEEKSKRKAASKQIGSLTPEQKRARARRKMKGAEKRIATHEDRRDNYRDIINRREITKTNSKGDLIHVPLSEVDVQEYRAKKLMEEALIMKSKNQFDSHKSEYELILGSTNASLIQALQTGRSTEYARRMGPKTAEKVLEVVKVNKGFADLKKKASGKRKEFRIALWNLVEKANAELKTEFEAKPKLFTRVVEILEEQLKAVKVEAGTK